MDIVFIILTVIFFVLSWGLAVLCDRLSAAGQANASSKG
jgi:preprotein translocase subunit SecG